MATRIITPKTTVADLLADFPQLESLLIDTAPVFVKLKNPVLRKTIAKVTTIAQAATIAHLPVDGLVNTLRKAVGQATAEALNTEETTYQTHQPNWFDPAVVVDTIDVTQLLDRGEQPVHEVLARLKYLADGDILAIRATFMPAPLIDKTLSLGFEHWIKAEEKEVFTVYFHR